MCVFTGDKYSSFLANRLFGTGEEKLKIELFYNVIKLIVIVTLNLFQGLMRCQLADRMPN
jgi:hypothetical protein